MNIEFDTGALLDVCRRCKSPAVFYWRRREGGPIIPRVHPGFEWKASCSQCAEETDLYDNMYSASHAWNRAQRKPIQNEKTKGNRHEHE